MSNDVTIKNRDAVESVSCSKKDSCPQLKGTLLRIKIPAGAVINLLNLIEIQSPTGICLIIRIPIFDKKSKHNIDSLVQAIKNAGGSIEFLQE